MNDPIEHILSVPSESEGLTDTKSDSTMIPNSFTTNMFTLPPLPYEYDALEPAIDETTMRLHHDKHHQAYIDNLNTALKDNPELQNKSIEELLRMATDLPETIRTVIQNHGGGHANHSLFWDILTPNFKELAEDSKLRAEIISTWSTIDAFKELLTQTALKQFGSGWGWLVVNAEKKLEVYATSNQDSPIMKGHTPLLGFDVWEHAYYLNYQNKRIDYLNAIWKIVNWEKVEELYTKTL